MPGPCGRRRAGKKVERGLRRRGRRSEPGEGLGRERWRGLGGEVEVQEGGGRDGGGGSGEGRQEGGGGGKRHRDDEGSNGGGSKHSVEVGEVGARRRDEGGEQAEQLQGSHQKVGGAVGAERLSLWARRPSSRLERYPREKGAASACGYGRGLRVLPGGRGLPGRLRPLLAGGGPRRAGTPARRPAAPPRRLPLPGGPPGGGKGLGKTAAVVLQEVAGLCRSRK